MVNYWRESIFSLDIYFKELLNHKICQVNFGKLLRRKDMLMIYGTCKSDGHREHVNRQRFPVIKIREGHADEYNPQMRSSRCHFGFHTTTNILYRK
jgi:hypothetical protein